MQNFEYENIEVINDLVKELNVLLKRENSLQDSIHTSINTLNDYTTLQEIKLMMENSKKTNLTYTEQTKLKSLLITDNVFLSLYEEFPNIFQEINLEGNDLLGLSVEEQNIVLKQLMMKVTKDNNKLVDYLKDEQSAETLIIINKFKVFINNQYTHFLNQIKTTYKSHVFPMEDIINIQIGVNSISSLSTLKKVHLILTDIDNSLKLLN
ncbi:hypothetical protein AWRI3580_g2104 [Hanseniaspora uvarum]|uniref:Uncharacterized protein n=1 Tax=Hanseniaspora uvarum TaxID=29833 RepID=A0A1E5RQE7_HANUV|nr:hypothetical protein AWRI3580_g2104 [Hanseniaspora uvarum]